MVDERCGAGTLAGRVADGEPVDWHEALRDTTDEHERRLIRQLRVVAGLAEVHRSGGSAWPPRESTGSPDATLAGDAHRAGLTAIGSWGHLELRERLGGGAFGQVYRAFDPRLDREVALKLIDKAGQGAGPTASRAVAEGRLLAKLRHPNVVAVHGAEVHDGRVGIWMEYIRGRSLEQALRERGPFGAGEAALIGVELCRALAAVHQAGVIHRDVKADNAMRESGGRILLTDFGAGVELQAAEQRERTISGTPLYMAPELFRGEPADARSDIYSLGVLLYRLVTASFPVEAASWRELRDKHSRREARLLRDRRADLPEGFVHVVERATAPEPAARFATAGAMEQALTLALGADRGAGGVSGEPAAVPGASRRRGMRWALIAATAALAVTVAAFWPRAQVDPDASSYSVDAALYRVSARSKTRQRVESGSRLTLGDDLQFEIRTSVPVHVYVISEDDAGHALALFPLPGFEPRNPLAAGMTHVLPGTLDGQPRAWTVDSPGGRERVLVLASPTRLVEFEAEMNALARPGLMAVPLSDDARRRLRGIGGLSVAPVTDVGGSAGALFEMAERLGAGAEKAHGVWVRQLEFDNPPPK